MRDRRATQARRRGAARCLLLLMVTLPSLAWAAPVDPPQAATQLTVRHVPRSDATPGKPLHMDFQIRPASRLDEAWVAYRTMGTQAWRRAPIRMGSRGVWRATIPADAVSADGVEYVVHSRTRDGVEQRHFGSENTPHTVLAPGVSHMVLRRVALREIEGRRSEVRIQGHLVDYSTAGRDPAFPAGPSYYDTTLAYRFWLLHAVEFIEAGVGRLRGSVPDEQGGRKSVGYDRGWAEVGFRLQTLIGLAARLELGGDEDAFRLGFAGRLRMGRARGTRFLLEAGYASGVGTQMAAIFHLQTIPRFPMRLDIVLTNWPDDGEATGELVRLTFGHRLASGHIVSLQASYQALSGQDHGLGAGLQMDFRF